MDGDEVSETGASADSTLMEDTGVDYLIRSKIDSKFTTTYNATRGEEDEAIGEDESSDRKRF